MIEQEFTPVFLGTAYRNKGVQPLLDAVVRYLPSPLDAPSKGKDPKDQNKIIELEPDPTKPFVGMAFKIVDDEFGQLTFTRIYQGKIEKGGTYFNQRTGKKERFSRIVKMHADKREEIDVAEAGDIVAIMGIDCASGDTYCSEPNYCTLENIFIAKPVIKMSIKPISRDNADRLGKALQRFRKEDPTFQVMTDEETGETVIAGMGELHLEIYVERIRREYKVDVEVGAPKVSYRESATKAVAYDFTHKKQTGGSGQYAHIVGKMGPMTDEEAAETEGELLFDDKVRGGRIPKNFIPAIEKGFRNMLAKGPVAGLPRGRHQDRAQRRQVPRSRQLGHGVHGLRPELLPRDVPEDEAGAARADHADGARDAGELPRHGGGQHFVPPRHRDLDRHGQQRHEDHRRSAAGRDVRLLDRPALDDARSGHVHDGTGQVPPRADEHPGRDHRRAQGGAAAGVRQRECRMDNLVRLTVPVYCDGQDCPSYDPNCSSSPNQPPAPPGVFPCATESSAPESGDSKHPLAAEFAAEHDPLAGVQHPVAADRDEGVAGLLDPGWDAAFDRLVEVGGREFVECLERGGADVSGELEVLVFREVVGRVVGHWFAAAVAVGETGRQLRHRTGRGGFDQMAFGCDQMAELPGDVIRVGHGPHQQLLRRDVGKVAVHHEVGDMQRRANCIFEVHDLVPWGQCE